MVRLAKQIVHGERYLGKLDITGILIPQMTPISGRISLRAAFMIIVCLASSAGVPGARSGNHAQTLRA